MLVLPKPVANVQPPLDEPAPSTPEQLPSPPSSVMAGVLANTPRFKADAELMGRYANALSTAPVAPLTFTQASQSIGPIPIDSAYGQCRQLLDSLLASSDFKQWAHGNRIDLTKPIRIFPAQGSVPGFIAATQNAPASTEATPGALSSTKAHTAAFGIRFGNGVSLPASWPLIMQAASTLAAGRPSVSVAPVGQSSTNAHAERPATLEALAAFYGEVIPDTQAAHKERANALEQAGNFPQQHTRLTSEQLEMRTEAALENLISEQGDISNKSRLSHLLSTGMAKIAQAGQSTATSPSFIETVPSSEQAAQNERTSIAALLSDTQIEIEPSSWYFQDEQLLPDSKVSLKQFIADNGWSVPQTRAEVNNLIQHLQRGPLPQVPLGNLTGAMGWAVPLDDQEKKQLYSHVRLNNLNLPDLEAQSLLEIRGGAFTHLTKNRHWTRAELNNPRQVIQDILDSPKAAALENALQQKMGATDGGDSRDWTMAAMVAGLDSVNLLGTPKRNHTAGFNLADERFYGKPLSAIKQGLIEHLVTSHRSTAQLAPVAAYLLLSHAAPELLVKDIPAEVTYGSPTWFSLKATIASIEAKSPGLGSQMSFAEAIKYSAIDPVTAEDQALQSAAKQAALVDWALVHGELQPSDTGNYSAEQLSAAQSSLASVMGALQTLNRDLTTEPPQQKDLALAELGKRFLNIDFERASITDRESKTRNALNSGLLDVNTGPYSLLDIYLSDHALTTEKDHRWIGDAGASAADKLGELPDIKLKHHLAVTDYQQRKEGGVINLTKHLIAQLPIEDRKQLEYGKLEVFIEGKVTQHQLYAGGTTVNNDRSTPEQDKNRRSLIIRSTHEGSAQFYELNPQQNSLKRREDLTSDFKPGPQGKWVSEDPGHVGGQKYTNTAITEFAVPSGDKSKLEATTPPHATPPASYTSARSQFLGELLARHIFEGVDIDEMVEATRHQTRFEEEDAEFEANQQVLLAGIPFVTLAQNALKGNWEAVAAELINDGVMYVTTAGLGKSAKALKPLRGALVPIRKPFGKSLFDQVATFTSQGISDNLRKLRPGQTASYNLSKATSRPDIVEGVYKKGLNEISTPARLDGKTGKWFAYDSSSKRIYGRPLEGFKPQTSTLVDDTLAQAPNAPLQNRTALDKALSRDNVVQMGGDMKDLKFFGSDIYTFSDTYKGTNRLNIIGHGLQRNWAKKLLGDGTKVFVDGALHTPKSLVQLMKARGIDPSIFDNVRLLICESADGKSRSFARLFQKEIRKPVKAFEGSVTISPGPEVLKAEINTAVLDDIKTNPGKSRLTAEREAQAAFVNLFKINVLKNNGQKILIDVAGLTHSPRQVVKKVQYLPHHFNG